VSSDRTVGRREIEDSTAARLAEIVAAAEQAAKQVIDEAEADARARLIDAHEEADRIVAERLAGLAELTDEIAAQAEALRRQSETLQRALAEAKAELGGAESLGGSALMGRRTADRGSGPEPDLPKPVGPALTVVGGAAEEKLEAEEPPSEVSTNGTRRQVAADGPRAAAGESGAAAEEPRAATGEPEDSASPAGARLLATQMAVSGSSRAEIEARLRNGFAIDDTRAILDAILGPES
jgi:vacuolar-type H+-ATPase subunit H